MTALCFLQRTYRDAAQPLATRIRCAVEALPFENPKISAVAVGNFTGQDFAAQLDRAIRRPAAGAPLKLIEAQAAEVD